MRVILVLPEFHEGGVERHVLWLANELAAMGHDVTVVSAGGKLEQSLKGVKTLRLPVHRKNPLTAIYSAIRIAGIAKREKIDVLHAHSRVPAWISWWASLLSGIPWIATCHAFYSRNAGLIPYKKASALICVSESVYRFFLELFPDRDYTVIYNGLPPSPYRWNRKEDGTARFLFVGRLTRKKGIITLIEAFSRVGSGTWRLDVIGDGPLMGEAKALADSLGLGSRIVFHGFQDTPEQWMAECSCFLFPSLEEGMGLTLMRAVEMGVAVIASDLPAVRELAASPKGLVVPGDTDEWTKAIEMFLTSGRGTAEFDRDTVPSTAEMAKDVEAVYRQISKKRRG